MRRRGRLCALRFAGERCPANAVVYGLISLAQNGGKGSGVLTKLRFEGEGRS